MNNRGMQVAVLLVSLIFLMFVFLFVSDDEGQMRAMEEVFVLETNKAQLENDVLGLTLKAETYHRICAEPRSEERSHTVVCVQGDDGGLGRWESEIEKLHARISLIDVEIEEMRRILSGP